jgi:DNA polymerase family A
MQNLPRGEYRKCVAAPPGRVLVKADYSQVELRIAAKASGDKALMAAYERGDDLHTLTARQVLGIAEVTKEHRQLAKALNFGLLYGMGAKGFRNYARSHYGLGLTEDQAVGGTWPSRSVSVPEMPSSPCRGFEPWTTRHDLVTPSGQSSTPARACDRRTQ